MRLFFILAILLFAYTPPALAQEGTYICPMHPHITGEKGDNCPICGMFLTEKESEGHEGHDHSSHASEPPKETSLPSSADTATYICPMHPHITGEEGDNCPICGMFLTPKETEDAPTEHDQHKHGDKVQGSIRIDPSYIQSLGVKTTTVKHQNFGKDIRSFGQIEASTRLEHAVDVRTKGWIVDLKTDAIGDEVKKGDLLFTFYSPDLMSAQSDYLIGRTMKNAEERLRLFGMDEKAVSLLKEKKKFLKETPFHAPMDGTVTMLNVRKGTHVNEGGQILTIQNFSKVWVNADVPIRDLQLIHKNTPARVIVSETGQEFETVIDYIHPVNNPKSRTASVRLVLENNEGALKPGTYVDVLFNAGKEQRLILPSDAVLYSNSGTYVLEDLGEGRFKPLMVKTGLISSGYTEIKDGLSHGQKIVISGQFMIDAESNLRGGIAAMELNTNTSKEHIHVH